MKHLLLLCLVLGFAPALAWPDISLPKIFSDHMVIQRNTTLRIHGTASPEEKLTISFGDKKTAAVANQSGAWSTVIQTGPAGGPFDLEVASDTRGGARVVIKDVLVGDVWLCCGQDNMQAPVTDLEDADDQIRDAKNYPLIRLFNVEDHQANQPLDDFANVNPWLCCSSESIQDFSALGFLFGKQLNRKLGVPIGLVDVARDGITLEAWTPYEALQNSGQFGELLSHWKEQNEPNNPNSPSNSFNGMISPLTKFPIAGIIWFHGEANVGRGAQYTKMFPVTIQSWRRCFNSPDLPFYYVQPAPFRYEDFSVEALPEIWEAQLQAFKSVPHTGLVVSVDASDGSSVNVKQKQKLAQRLVGWALAADSNSKTVTSQPPPESETTNESNSTTTSAAKAISGPIFESAKIDANQVLITFRYADNGLKLAANTGNSFVICGTDKKFLPAEVEIKGSKLVVSHPDIEDPLAVRYGWLDTHKPTLTNSSGLPASPFRTDRFPLSSEGVHF